MSGLHYFNLVVLTGFWMYSIFISQQFGASIYLNRNLPLFYIGLQRLFFYDDRVNTDRPRERASPRPLWDLVFIYPIAVLLCTLTRLKAARALAKEAEDIDWETGWEEEVFFYPAYLVQTSWWCDHLGKGTEKEEEEERKREFISMFLLPLFFFPCWPNVCARCRIRKRGG